MTQYRFTQSVSITRKTFRVGIQEVPPEIEAHPDFLHFVQAGWIHEVEPEELVQKQPRTVESRGAELAKKIAAKGKPEQAREQVRETPQAKAARTRREKAAAAKLATEAEKKGEEE